MPHHSKHSQQQRNQLESSATSSPGGYSNQQQIFQNSSSCDNVSYRRNPTTSIWMDQNVVPEKVKNNSYHQGQYHRVPSSPPDAAGSGIRIALSGSQDGLDAYKSNKRDPSQEIASVLLIAAAAATSAKEISNSINQKDDVTRNIEIVETQSNRPLKKRKSVDLNGVVDSSDDRTNPDDTYHVSPISHSSKSGATVESNAMSHDTPSTSSAHSFDMKEDATSTSNGTNMMNPDASYSRSQKYMYRKIHQFPSLLHWMLSESSTQSSSVDLSVLQWVSHGQAWRIIRWDAFHRTVIPALFPQLVSGATTMGSIDAFMWQLKAWGFQEIKDGPDIGAFAHTFFRRGHPKMCEEMKFDGMERAISSSLALDTRSILRVPSLSSSSPASIRPKTLSESAEKSSASSIGIVDFTGSPLHHHTPATHQVNKFLPGQQNGPPAYVNYRPEEMNLTPDGWQLSSKYNVQTNWGSSGIIPTRKVVDIAQTISPYSPIRIRSSRGARRNASLGSSISDHNSPCSSTTSPLNGSSAATSRAFPVSNRGGMGRRNIVAPSATKTSATTTGPASAGMNEVVMLTNFKSSASSDLEESPTIAEASFPRSVLKRKLPLMASTAEDVKTSE